MKYSLCELERVLNEDFAGWSFLLDEGMAWKEFWGKNGKPIMVTISEMGATVRSKEGLVSPLSEKEWKRYITSTVEIFLVEYFCSEGSLSPNNALDIFFPNQLNYIYQCLLKWNSIIR
ncbi:hypothetical protein ACFC4S_26475 [Priestia megaterium]|uniref:hypothetical protein n=1 Tax=Priestia megaterium TaxID=1404 RepID=UPI001D8B5FE5|nr:hypothetical protein [Priestia megaterium]